MPADLPKLPPARGASASGSPTARVFTVADVAASYGVSEAVVLNWIRNQELRALNVGRAGSRRPTWRITSEAIAEFEAKRTQTLPVARRQRRRKVGGNVIEFYR